MEYPLPVATRAIALVAALFGFYVFVTHHNFFASFGAILLATCALMVAFSSIADWMSGKGLASERGRVLRFDLITLACTTAICAAFLALAPR